MQKTNNQPAVSVIIPTYNRAHLIGRAIQSVLDQTYEDYEIIVVDDRSTDNTEEVINEFRKKDERIRYIRHEKNKGGSAARNTGIKAAQGVYIAFHDSDDEWFPRKLAKQMEFFSTAKAVVGVTYTGFWRIEGDKKVYIPWSWVAKKDGNIHQELLKGNFVGTPSIVTRKECFERAGLFDESLPRLQDWDLVLRLSKHYDFKCIDEPLLNSYYTIDSISANNEGFIKAFKLILSKHFDDFAKDNKYLSNSYYFFGNYLCSNNDFSNGRVYFIKAAKINPVKAKYLFVAFLSFFGQSVYNRFMATYQKIKGIMG